MPTDGKFRVTARHQLSFFKSSGGFAMFAVTRRASSFVNLPISNLRVGFSILEVDERNCQAVRRTDLEDLRMFDDVPGR